MQHQSLCVPEKNASFPSQLLNAVSPLILLAPLSQHHLHPQMPFQCAHRKESILSSQRKNYPQPKQLVPGAKEGWWSYRQHCFPWRQWAQWCSVLRGPLASKDVLNPSPHTGSRHHGGTCIQEPLAKFCLTSPGPSTSRWMLYSPLPPALVWSSVLRKATAHLWRKAESPFHSKLHRTHFIMTGFVSDESHYLCAFKIQLLSFLLLPKANIF